jgi:glycosyltransferase involved in cell wall biosynthesis
MLTVLLATRNRAELLRSVLNAYTKLLEPSGGWKLVIVNNGSTDKTAEVLTSFQGELPVRWLSEPKLGKNFALNTGLGAVEGDLVVFTDDDTFPAGDWLVQLRRAADHQPGYAMFGGTILPRWEVPPPHWVGWVDQAAAFTLSDSSLGAGKTEAELVFGPNMAIRMKVFESGVRFDTSIGPRGSSYPMGSETELLLRLGRQGHLAWHVPSAVVEHFIRQEQLTMQWVLRRAIRFGRGQYRLYGPAEPEKKSWMGVPRYLLRKQCKQCALIFWSSLFFRKEAFFRARWRFNFFKGQLIEARNLAREQSERKLSTPDPVRRPS